MRAILVLATILSFATPQVSWRVIELTSPGAVAISLSAPAAGSQIVRAAVKTDKTFGFGFAIAADVQPLFPPRYTTDGHSIGSPDVPNLDLSVPPLAARPPPSL